MYCHLETEDCIACGRCQLKAPQLFDYDDEGLVIFNQHPNQTDMELDETQIVAARQAAQHCPTRVIRLTD